MTIGERINLHRCGYTRAEIDALAAAEKEEQQAATQEAEPTEAQAAQPEEHPEAAAPAASTTPQPNKEILDAINNLAAVIQSRNVNTQQQPQPPQQTVTDLINTL